METFRKHEEHKLWGKVPWALGGRKGLRVGVGSWDSQQATPSPGALAEPLTSFLFTVALSQRGANCGIACLDLHLSQEYLGPWKFPWDDTKPCPTFIFFFFWLRTHSAKSMLSVSSQSNSSGTCKRHPSHSAFWSSVPSEACNDRAATICEICLRSVYCFISSLICCHF